MYLMSFKTLSDLDFMKEKQILYICENEKDPEKKEVDEHEKNGLRG